MITRIRCRDCRKEFDTHVARPCPHCGVHNRVPPRESLGYRILMVILWIDVAITIGSAIYLLGGG
jgi:hypothetical protein